MVSWPVSSSATVRHPARGVRPSSAAARCPMSERTILAVEFPSSPSETDVLLCHPNTSRSRSGVAAPGDGRTPAEPFLPGHEKSGRALPHSKILAHGSYRHSEKMQQQFGTWFAKASAECSSALDRFGDSLRQVLWRFELAALALLIAVLNLPLLTGAFSTQFIFHPDAVGAGEWLRLFTHPFVHVSRYHLALDSLAFFLAYTELKQWSFRQRVTVMVLAGAGSLLVALAASPLITTHGLCGLSGIAHGLTAVVSLEMLRRSSDSASQWAGLLCFLCVTGKSLLELATGNVLFASWHPGWLGTPIAACHAGGVLGAALAWLIFQRKATSNRSWFGLRIRRALAP